MKTEFVKFLVEEAVPLIRAGKATFEDIILKFKAQFGREPEGVESIAIRKEFTKPEGKLVDMQGNTLDPNKPIMGGTQEGIPTTIEGKTKNMSVKEIMDFVQGKKGKGAVTTADKAPVSSKVERNRMFEDMDKRINDEMELLKDMQSSKSKARMGSNVDYEKIGEMFPNVALRGDETFDELLIIEKTGKHPRDK
jgi:hypothetical protein